MSAIEKPRPDVADPVVAGYWSASHEGKLAVSRCTNCEQLLWPPEEVCPNCLHIDFDWVEVEPRGVLWSYAVYHRALDPAFVDDVPYAVGLIELESGFKMYGIMRGELDELEVGAPVEAVFEPFDDEVTFVRWRTTRSTAEKGTLDR